MKKSLGRLVIFLFVAGAFLLPASMQATVFSWGVASYGSNTWQNGVPPDNGTVTNSYNNDTTNGAGNDIQISVAQVGAGDTFSILQVNSVLVPGANSGLELETSKQGSLTTYVKVTISFIGYYAATGVSFTIFDVDKSATPQWIDQISSIQGITLTGGTLEADTLTPANNATWARIGASNLLQSASGTAANTDGNANGNVNIAFTGTVTSVSFLWNNLDSTLGNQHIALSNITYTGLPTPEMNPGMMAVLACGVAVFARKFRRNR